MSADLIIPLILVSAVLIIVIGGFIVWLCWPKKSPSPPPLNPQNIEELHRQYEGMAETHPWKAGILKYQDQLKFHR